MKKRVLLKDIAQQVGVSTALVSYVLNNKFKDRINKDLAEKIRQTAKEMNYRPNQIAKSLRTDKTFTIGLVVADIANPFSAQIARIIEDYAKKENYSAIFGSSDESPKKAQDLIELFLNHQVDGLILALPEHCEKMIEDLKSKSIPFVLIDRHFSGVECKSVSINNRGAAQKAISHLYENGHKRIGVIGYDTTLCHLNERIQGAKDLIKENALEGKIRIDHVEEDIAIAIDRFLSDANPPTALFFTTVLLTVSGLKYLKKMNIEVPSQLAVIGFDETEAYDLYQIPVTYIRQPLRELGKKAVELLLSPDENSEHPDSIVLEAELVINGSSG